MSRNEFLERRAYYQKQSDFTPKEKKELTFQEQNFVRGIQIVREKQKNDAIRHYKRIRKKARAQVKALSIEIQAFYDKPDILGVDNARGEWWIGSRDESDDKPAILGADNARGEWWTRPGDKSVIITPQKSPKYIYATYAKKALLKDRNRFKSLGGTARRYTDLRTGEIISRRERDKRLFILVTNY